MDDAQLVRSVGRRIAELRVRVGWTQEEFAEAYVASVKYIQAVELGRQNLTLTSLAKVARTLGVPVRELLRPPRSLKANPGRPPKRAGAKSKVARRARAS